MNEEISTTVETDERVAAITRAFLSLHPRVAAGDVQVEAVPQGFHVSVGRAHFLGVITSPRQASFAPVDPRDLDTPLAPPQPATIPPVAEPVAPAAVGFDPALESRRLRTVLDAVRRAEYCRRALRAVEETEAAEIERLRGLVPLDAIDATGRTLSPEGPLHQVALDAALARTAVEALGAALREAQALLTDVRPRLRQAQIETTAARGEGLRGLGSLATAGETTQHRATAHAEALDVVEDQADALARALAEVAPLLGLFQSAMVRTCRATLQVVREVGLALRLQRLVQIKQLMAEARAAYPVEAMAEQACSGLDVSDLPVVHWPPHADAPTLAPR